MRGDVSVRFVMCPRDRRRRDVDNYLKQGLDSLEHSGCFFNDQQVVHICASKCRCMSCFLPFVMAVQEV